MKCRTPPAFSVLLGRWVGLAGWRLSRSIPGQALLGLGLPFARSAGSILPNGFVRPVTAGFEAVTVSADRDCVAVGTDDPVTAGFDGVTVSAG